PLQQTRLHPKAKFLPGSPLSVRFGSDQTCRLDPRPTIATQLVLVAEAFVSGRRSISSIRQATRGSLRSRNSFQPLAFQISTRDCFLASPIGNDLVCSPLRQE